MATSSKRFKYVVVGAGPGGLQMGYYLGAQRRNYVILEKANVAGSFFQQFPVHRTLISINKKHNFFAEEDFGWRHDWNSLLSDDPEMRFTRYTDDLFPQADRFQEYLQDFADRFSLNIEYATCIERIERDAQGGFVLHTNRGSYSCEVLLLGLGAVSERPPADIEGIELATPYQQQSLDRELYRNKRIGILGQGNSAFETAEYLAGSAAFVHILAKRPIRFAWETHFVGDLRAINNNIFDLYQLKAMHAVLNPRVVRIDALPNGALQTTHEYDFPNATVPGTLQLTREYDHILCCTGWNWTADGLFAAADRPASKAGGKFPLLSTVWESTNVANLFFVGGAMQAIDRQSASGFMHGYRYNIKTLAGLLEERYEGIPYPERRFAPLVWDEVLDWFYSRISTTPALFQLFGFLCDSLTFSRDLKSATLHQELPIAHARERRDRERHVLLFTLEFGFHHFSTSTLSFLGPSDPTNPACAAFLHPVVRHLHGDRETEFHFGDSLLARWDKPHAGGGAVMPYHDAFRRWLAEQLGVALPDVAGTGGRSPYRPWTSAELAQWKAAHSQPAREAICKSAS